MLEIKSVKSKMVGPLSLSVKKGQCVAILGKSGSGKSLFLRAIADLDPNEGEIFLNGEDRAKISACEWRRKLMLVPAQSGWWADTVGEHFGETAKGACDASKTYDASKTNGACKTNGASIIASLLASLDLPPKALSWQVSRLSTGERQRLALARAFALQPLGLMLDEPTAALDPDATARVEALIKQQLALGVCVILITHDAKQAARLADVAYMLANNQLTVISDNDRPGTP